MDRTSDDTARLFRAFGLRAFALALFVWAAGEETLAVVLVLVGLGLLSTPVHSGAERHRDDV